MQPRLSSSMPSSPNGASPQATPKKGKVAKTLAAIAAVLVGLGILLVVGFNQMYQNMTPHEQGLANAWKDDFLHGRWDFKGTRETAQRNLDKSKQKLEQANKDVVEAERKYQEALADQKRIVAEAKKRKAEKAQKAKTVKRPVAERERPEGRDK